MASKEGNIKINKYSISRSDELEGGEEIEIAGHVSVPTDGGWGWVVVTAGIFTMAVVDGIGYTFGSIIHEVARDFDLPLSLASIVNSITVSLYFASGPLVSAFINRFGFRTCAMTGSVCTAFSLFISYFVSSYALLCIFYGVLTGFGLCLMQMSTTLVVGFYFEKLRSLTLSMVSSGASMGVMILYPIFAFVAGNCGWRTVVMLEAGLCGVVYFVTMTYRPLLSFSVVAETEPSDIKSRTVTYLPSISSSIKGVDDDDSMPKLKATVSERVFKAVSNKNFPSVGYVIDNTMSSESDLHLGQHEIKPGPSASSKSRFTLIAHNPVGGITERQVKEVKSVISKLANINMKTKRRDIVNVEVKTPPKKHRGCFGRFCHWDGHITESRPMYRDDVFYDGNVSKLPIYKSSQIGIPERSRTGLEYQLAVTRAVTAEDLAEKKGVFTTAARRVLSTMLDLSLLKRPSFMLTSLSSFIVYLGFLVPYIYVQDRAKTNGIEPRLTNFLVSTISLSNLMGRLIWGSLACKFDPIKMYVVCDIMAGISIIVSNFYFNVYFQFGVCFVFGFFGAATSAFRGIQIVHLYGLEKLTNGMGLILLFSGMGTLLGPIIASSLKQAFDTYSAAFYASGMFIFLAGLILIPVSKLCFNENEKFKRLKYTADAQRAARKKKYAYPIPESGSEEDDD